MLPDMYNALELSPLLRFISTEVVQLRSTDSECPFYVHKALLKSRCEIIYSALSKGFLESREGVYTCTDTTHDTLGWAVEWMYTGGFGYGKPVMIGDRKKAETATNLSELVEAMKSHRLIVLLRLYIFGDLYLINGLKEAAFDSLRKYLRVRWLFHKHKSDQGVPSEMHLPVIALLYLAFSKVRSDDELLTWLAQFASCNLNPLREQPFFNDLLDEAPWLSSFMMASLRPASSPPWDAASKTRDRMR